MNYYLSYVVVFFLLYGSSRAEIFADCGTPRSDQFVDVAHDSSSLSTRYFQDTQCVNLYRETDMLADLGPHYAGYRRDYYASNALVIAGMALPLIWTGQLFYWMNVDNKNSFQFFHLNWYTFSGSLAVGLAGLIPYYWAREHLDILVEQHNARLGFRLHF